MFGSIIQDAYTEEETIKIVEALDELCNPNDVWGWASAGIYCFWNYQTKEVLYIGLAVDLMERFKQHNGIIQMDPNGCKYEKIQTYFKTEEKLGYSIFTQSPYHQPVIKKNIYKWWQYDQKQVTVSDFKDEQTKRDLRKVEGILIEAYKMHHGHLPPWNSVGGDIQGQHAASIGNYKIVQDFTHQTNSPLIARHTLREISINPTFTTYESYLHGARQLMLLFGHSFSNALKHCQKRDPHTHNRVIEDNYLLTELKF
ncbi:GIY-YIG nuclease family protein [Bacillus sp. SI2]|uniref:GIY-YIG nuclease family protein n=1 Tax=Bacillus sp. SI2 TaxID=3077323 RepID=UPI0028EAB24A|nr:GIY-YIG nuclease family protein [Bacillus sp. SI2]WNV20007.1 GIY-YIG nuclease family protein [Bacillus sp. SI2]